MATFGSVYFEPAVGVLVSKIVVLAELVVLIAVDFCESVDVWTTSSIISTILGLGDLLGLEIFWDELEFCLFSLGRIFYFFLSLCLNRFLSRRLYVFLASKVILNMFSLRANS